jgi:glycosyltransferase involved in cell wall biosynthesis
VATLLTIAVPAYDEEATLEAAVDDALTAGRALGEPFEVLVIEDGSTDGTPALSDRLAEAHPEVRVHHHESNRGFTGAMRSCARHAQGTYMFMAPADGQGSFSDLRRFFALREDYDLIFSMRLERSDSRRRKVSSGLWYLFLRFLFAYQIPEFSALFFFRLDQIPELPIAIREDASNYLPLLYVTAMKSGRRVGVLGIIQHERRGGQAKGFDLSLTLRTLAEDMKIWWLLRIRPPR